LEKGAPAELIRLLPLVGIDAEVRASEGSPVAPSRDGMPPSALPVAVHVRFGGRRAGATGFPATLTIAIAPASRGENTAADFVATSSKAAACFILSRALGLRLPVLTADDGFFEVIRSALAVARGPARVLVEGEIGVGKESLVKLIHAASGDPAALVYAECAGLEEEAVESEIAPLIAQAAGSNFAQVHAGGLFLNRICELSPAAQRKLLHMILTAPGAAPGRLDAFERRYPPPKMRYLAASTQPIAAMVERGAFLPELHDLFDVTLTIPPLRSRRGDLPILVRYYLRLLNPGLSLSAAAMRTLSMYPFPGNVLELINFVTRIAIIPSDAGTRHSGTRIVGRADVIAQLEHASLNAAWRSHGERKSLHRLTRRMSVPSALERADDEIPQAAPAPDADSPDTLRLTTATVPRRRKPHGGGKRPA
jgi:DNA-binding NtrC family response regulator